MHSTGMSDWNWSEFEDINWDVDVKSGDHVVPHQSSELLDEPIVLSHAHKNPRHEVKYVDGRNFCVGDSANKTVVWGKEDTWYPPTKRGSSSVLDGSWPHTSHIAVPKLRDHESIANGTAFPSQDARIFDYCVNKSSTDAKTSMFYLKDPQLGTKVSTKDNKFCLSSHNGVSPDVTVLSYIESVRKGRDDKLAYYDWSNINNFEDVDKMFGNCDSTFEHGQTSIADDPPWLSSSNNICGSENAFEQDFQPQGGDLGALHVKTDSYGSNVNFLHKNLPSTSGHDKPTSCNYAAWLDTGGPSKVVSADNEKKNFMGSPSSHIYGFDPHSQLAFGLPMHHVPFTQITSSVKFEGGINRSSSYSVSDHVVNYPIQCLEMFPDHVNMPQDIASENNTEILYQRRQLSGAMTASNLHQQLAIQNSVKKKLLEARDGFKMENADLKHPTVNTVGQENYGMTSLSSDDILEMSTSFQLLQDAIHQLDVSTKLCIRESLYRLARSARQRQGFTTQNYSKGIPNTKGIQDAEVSKSGLVEFMDDVETNTNLLDRSIAHLLFHMPSVPAMRSADIRSLEPHVMNEEVLVPNQLVCEGIIGGFYDVETHLPQDSTPIL